MGKFRLTIEVDDSGKVDIASEGVCHHIYLIGVLHTIINDIMNAASTIALTGKENKDGEGERTESGPAPDTQ